MLSMLGLDSELYLVNEIPLSTFSYYQATGTHYQVQTRVHLYAALHAVKYHDVHAE